MKKIISAFILATVILNTLQAQNTFPSSGAVGIGTATPNASSLLDVTSTTKGVLVPRMTKTQRDAIVSPTEGLLIYQTNSTPGFYYYDGGIWKAVSPKGVNKSLSNLTAPTAVNVDLLPYTDNAIDLGSASFSWNNLYVDGVSYLGSDAQINSLTIGKGGGSVSSNTALGKGALLSNSTGNFNTASGYQALINNSTGNYNSANGYYVLSLNTTGDYNTANGSFALYSNTTGTNNSAIGRTSLYSNTSGSSNVAIGTRALYNNTDRSNLVAIGDSALYNNGSGVVQTFDAIENTAVGSKAMFSNTSGRENTATGYNALYSNTSGVFNTATGYNALYSNTTGDFNVANGFQALKFNTTGSDNTAAGLNTMIFNTTGYDNTATGNYALSSNTTGFYNTADGNGAGSYNDNNTNCTFIGNEADQTVATDFTNSMALGNIARITASNQVRIGSGSVTSIGGFANWTNVSDGRYKKEIKENVPGLEFINKLTPVTYNLDVTGISKFLGEDITGEEGKEGFREKSSVEKSLIENGLKEKEQIVYTGFIAQDVEKAAKEIGYDFSGVDKPQNESSLYGLRYAEFVVPLVKAVQELDSLNNAKDGKIESHQKQIRVQQKQIDKLNAAVFGNTMHDGIVKLETTNSTESPLLGQNIPNPFDNTTIIPFRIPKNCNGASIVIAESVTGRIVTAIPITCSETHIAVEAGNLASGSYSYSLYVDGRMIETKQMVITK